MKYGAGNRIRSSGSRSAPWPSCPARRVARTAADAGRRRTSATTGMTRTSPRAASIADSQAARLAGALQALAKGLPNPWDESTDFFHDFVVPLPASTKLDAESFRSALHIGSRYEIDLSRADDRSSALITAFSRVRILFYSGAHFDVRRRAARARETGVRSTERY